MKSDDWTIYAAPSGGMGPWLKMWALNLAKSECYNLTCDTTRLKVSSMKLNPRSIGGITERQKLVGEFPTALIEYFAGGPACSASQLHRFGDCISDAGILRSKNSVEILLTCIQADRPPVLVEPLAPPAPLAQPQSPTGTFWGW